MTFLRPCDDRCLGRILDGMTVLARPGETGSTLELLRQSIVRRIAPMLRASGLAEHEVGCTLEGTPARLRVVLTGPPVAAAVRQAIGVRVLDAIHADGRTFGTVEVVDGFDDPRA